MRNSQPPGMKPISPGQNSKCLDICPRCTRHFNKTNGKLRPSLLNYYKNLCKNTKCSIHKKTATRKRKNELKLKKKKGKTRLVKRKKVPRFLPNQICRVAEFEDKKSEDIDPELFAKIEATVTNFEEGVGIKFEDIISHGLTKEIIKRTVIWPLKKPEIFKGLRSAPKGVLFFGPPGTGKTLIGKSIAFETQSTFFNISASTLTSKWMGESEKLVRTMFVVAKARQPSVIFIDEVDSILSQRTPDENGSSRRMKNEFLVCMDGSISIPEDRVMVIGATNRPQELDEAARRRFFKRLYIPLPDDIGRKELLKKLLKSECHSLEEIDINDIVKRTDGYSAADIKNLSQEAAMGPIKSLSRTAIVRLKHEKIRPISLEDFLVALELIKPTVTKEEVKAYEEWDASYGYGGESARRMSTQSMKERQKEKYYITNNPYIT